MPINRKEKHQPETADLDLWEKLMDELHDEIMASQPDSDELKHRTALMKRLVHNLTPSNRKLLVLYCQAMPYDKIQRGPELRKVKIPALRRRVCDLIKRLNKEYVRQKDRKKALKPICAQLQLDLTDYAAGHREYLPLARQQVLVGHIIKCPNCRQDFLDKQHILTMVALQAQSPASKRKMRAFIKRLISKG